MRVEEKVKKYLNNIKNKNKKINAILQINPNAIQEAREVDKKKKKGRLAGKVIAVKSCICVKGLEANCGSLTLKGYIAPYDASVVEKIKKQDGVIIGMCNMDEFACGSSGETSAFRPTQNPAAPGRIPGGSSSGSAAAVAADFCDMALGTDTGGSVRNPASHCGVVGIKPSYGIVSRYGMVDLSMSLEGPAVIAKNIEDAGLLLDVIKGKDENDAITYDSRNIKLKSVNKITIGVLQIKISDKRIKELVDRRIDEVCKKKGWQKKGIELKYIDLAVQTYYPIVYVEFFSGTRKFDGRKYGKKIEDVAGPEVLRRILGGREISQAEYGGRYYRKALSVKELVKKEFAEAFKKVDCIIIPTVPRLPHKIGEKISVEDMYAYDALTIPANLAEIPGISLPVGKIDGVPVGMQIFCKKFDEGKMLGVAREFE